MRQGPIYGMPVQEDGHGNLLLKVPLELVDDFKNCDRVNWRDDAHKGVFTLILIDRRGET